jgi:SHAQKYF class myb-like DNA-binding protein
MKKPRHRFLISNGKHSKIAEEQNREKKLKIRLSLIKENIRASNSTNDNSNSVYSQFSKKKKDKRIRRRDGNYVCGRWQPEEHQRFIEAILKYGNEWKSVQKHVGTRSSTQARSHAQKFFVKMKKSTLLNFDVDFTDSIKSLHSIASNLTKDEYLNALKALNCVAFERKPLPKKKREDDLFDIEWNLLK